MKCTLVFALALFAVVYSKETYTTENDNLDIELVINDPIKLKAFSDCFNDKGECDELTSHFKNDMPEAIQQACAKCTDAQKHILKRFLEGLKEKMPEGYQALKAKFDPDNKYFVPLVAAVSKY